MKPLISNTGYIPGVSLRNGISESTFASDEALPVSITKAASKQTYYVIRFLVDRDRVCDAYRAYAYFRWVDDWLDQQVSGRSERIAFLERQQALMRCCYRGEAVCDLLPEEAMLASLIRSDAEENSGLQAYIHNMMAVMAFDTYRRGRLISQAELAEYTRHLATGVTEALHYFIGHDDPPPPNEARYLAVTGAHITHMLRDTLEDVAAGYINIPCEFLKSHGIDPCAVQSDAHRAWVESRVQLARTCFEAGRRCLAEGKNWRCRIAGCVYIARFEDVLDAIEREGYRLRAEYLERKSPRGALKMSWSAFSMLVRAPIRGIP